jgi:hypothetical protein
VLFQWKAIKDMITNGFTKALLKQRFQSFVNMIKIVDIKEQLTKEKHLEDLQKKVRTRQKNLNKITV